MGNAIFLHAVSVHIPSEAEYAECRFRALRMPGFQVQPGKRPEHYPRAALFFVAGASTAIRKEWRPCPMKLTDPRLCRGLLL